MTEQAREFLLVVRVLRYGISRSHLKDGQRDLCSGVMSLASSEKGQGKLGLQCSVQVTVQALGLVLNKESVIIVRVFLGPAERLPSHSSYWPEGICG